MAEISCRGSKIISLSEVLNNGFKNVEGGFLGKNFSFFIRHMGGVIYFTWNLMLLRFLCSSSEVSSMYCSAMFASIRKFRRNGLPGVEMSYGR